MKKKKITAVVVGMLVMMALNGCATMFPERTYDIIEADGTVTELTYGEYIEYLCNNGRRDEALMRINYPGLWR